MKILIALSICILAACAQQPSDEYLPPVNQEYIPPDQDAGPAAPAHSLGDDGYQYKAIRRIRYRTRRDASELPQNEYLPPSGGEDTAEASGAGPIPGPEPAPAHDLGKDGYRYKTVRRIRYRHRRDVSELPQNEYLPPSGGGQSLHVGGSESVQASGPGPVSAFASKSAQASIGGPEPEPAHSLGNDGYRYKTVRRIRYRHRRDVSELPQNEYLPPSDEPAEKVQEPESDVSPPKPEQRISVDDAAEDSASEPAAAHTLGKDGYEYKTVRRIRYRHRHRRDVSELSKNEYLPPKERSGGEEISSDAVEEESSVAEDEPVPEPAPKVQEPAPKVKEPAPKPEVPAPSEPVPAHSLGKDGYEYKTVRKIKYRYRHRRDVSELPNSEYLPPNQGNVNQEYLPPSQGPAPGGPPPPGPEPGPAHTLSQDGYRYKTARRVRYRLRRY